MSGEPARAEICAVVLAAGRSTRFGGGATKLVAQLDGVPIVRRVAQAALASRARPVVVVTGHERARVEGALAGLPLIFAHPLGDGLSGSLRAGLGAAPSDAAGAVILLGDMPFVRASLIDSLIDAFLATPGAAGAAPGRGGRRANPALIGRALFAQVAALEGDQGARSILDAEAARLALVEAPDDASLIDVDTQEELARAQALPL